MAKWITSFANMGGGMAGGSEWSFCVLIIACARVHHLASRLQVLTAGIFRCPSTERGLEAGRRPAEAGRWGNRR